MLVTEIIRQKRDQKPLSDESIRFFMQRYSSGNIPDYQAAALLMAVFLHGLDQRELATWTDAMLHSGDVLQWPDDGRIRVDKHSTGGVGDKISIPLAPLVAACGVPVPMMVGRGLGHTGGTLDKLESIQGFNGKPSTERFRSLVDEIGTAIIGQTADIAPADRRLYALRDVTATVESKPLIASSIMSKKLAAGNDALVLDVKCGDGAFLTNLEDARELARLMIDIGERSGKKMRALITDMNQPLGRAIGNANEIRESIEILHNQGPADVRALTLALATHMLCLARPGTSATDARHELEARLASGQAFEKFRQMIRAQGGDLRPIDNPALLPQAPHQTTLRAPRAGYVQKIHCRELGVAALLLGAGRATHEDTIDHAVGLELLVRIGDRVEANQPLVEVHYRDEATLARCMARLQPSFQIGDQAPAELPLILDEL